MKQQKKKNRLDVHFSSARGDWATPPEIFKPLQREFNITFDLCASRQNAKCAFYYTRRDNALKQSWVTCGDQSNWLNPPYGRRIGLWVAKASAEAKGYLGATTVCLLPARTDTKWFHDYIYNKPNVEVRFLKGRVKFEGAKHAAPFPSMIVIFKVVRE